MLKTSCCNATERETIAANDSWACSACINLNQMKRKAVSTFRKERLWESHGTQPGSQKKYKTRENRESFKQSLKNYEEQITVPN
jgi:hypothetical protein